MKNKNRLLFTSIVFLGVLSLSSCTFLMTSSSLTSNTSIVETSSGSDSSTTSSSTSTTSSNTTTTSISSNKTLIDIEVNDLASEYYIGKTFDQSSKLRFKAFYDDDTSKDVTDLIDYTAVVIDLSNNTRYSSDYYVHKAGEYRVEITYAYEHLDGVYSYEINFQSGINLNNQITKITIEDCKVEYQEGDIFDKSSVEFKVVYDNNEAGYELIKYSDDVAKRISLNLNLGNNKTNIINNTLLGSDETYYLFALANNVKSNTITFNIEVINEERGYIIADSMSIVSSDFNHTYAPSLGEVKVLVIPISLDAGYSGITEETWTSQDLANLNTYYFGEKTNTPNRWNSFKSYYETASFNKMTVTGMVSEVYYEQDLTMSDVNNDSSFEKLFQLIDNAVDYIISNNPDIDWSEYDSNDDGCFDSIHLITNAGNQVDWSDPLWPHMYSRGGQGTIDKPGVNVYSISKISSVEDARTSIHEQGHIFGLDDYYDYTQQYNGYSTYIDYVGYADMQSFNMFDWNSFSKLSMGWVNPYVIDGKKDSVTLTLNAASLTGDCLIVPANFETWNGSAFDEYFLIELFSPYNNNKDDWQQYENDASYYDSGFTTLGDYGVRMYHVDARLAGLEANLYDYYYDGNPINSKEDIAKYDTVVTGANNSRVSSDYGYDIRQFNDFKLLTVIQKGKQDTFSSTNSSYYRHFLSEQDLFKPGDEFTFADYSHFLSKTGKTSSTTNEGEVFPYTIRFDSMSSEKVTITVSKN